MADPFRPTRSLLVPFVLAALPAIGQSDFPKCSRLCVLDVTLGAPDTLYVTLANDDRASFIDYPVVQVVDVDHAIIGNREEAVLLAGMGSGTRVHRVPTRLTSFPPGATATVVIKDALTLQECALQWPSGCSLEAHAARDEALSAFHVWSGAGRMYAAGLLPAHLGELELLDATGSLVKELPIEGSTTLLDLDDVPTGGYWIRYRVGRFARIRHIIVH